jgi:hypothetical protein
MFQELKDTRSSFRHNVSAKEVNQYKLQTHFFGGGREGGATLEYA